MIMPRSTLQGPILILVAVGLLGLSAFFRTADAHSIWVNVIMVALGVLAVIGIIFSIAKLRHLQPEKDPSPVRQYFYRHAVIHFAAIFCYWFTFTSLSYLVLARFGDFWPVWPEEKRLSYAFFTSILVYILDRYQMRRTWAQAADMKPPNI
jgi:heme A synthase